MRSRASLTKKRRSMMMMMMASSLLLQHGHGCSFLFTFLPLIFFFFFFFSASLAIALQYTQETVYFATDRDDLNKDPSKETVGRYDTRHYLEGLKYGTVNVGIPLTTNDQFNTTRRPVTQVENVVIYSLENMENNYTQFIQSINSKYFSNSENSSCSTCLDLYMFIHGYDTTFEYAIKRMAQLKFDLGFLGPTIAYSWSSQGLLSSYLDDEVSVEKTIPFCKEFIKLCVAKVEGNKMHILAHSMGNRALIGSMESMYTESDIGQVLSEGKMQLKSLIFAAADENIERFEGMVAKVKEVHEERRDEESRRPHLTVYCATDDLALQLSSVIHDHPRFGLTTTHFEQNATTLHEDPCTGYIDVIDATGLDDGDEGLHHSYYGNDPLCLLDIQTLLSSPPPLHRAYYRALDAASPIFNVTFDNSYHFYSFSPSFWNNSSL